MTLAERNRQMLAGALAESAEIAIVRGITGAEYWRAYREELLNIETEPSGEQLEAVRTLERHDHDSMGLAACLTRLAENLEIGELEDD